MLLSRHGILPAVRQRPVHHELRHFTAARFRQAAARGQAMVLGDTISLFCTEIAAAGEDVRSLQAEIDAVRSEDPVHRIRRQLSEIDSPSIALRILQQAVPDAGPDVWPALREWEQDRLLRDHQRVLMSLCCPMPPATACQLLSLFDSGQVTMVSGVRAIQPVPGGFAITAGSAEHHADVVVNGVNARMRQFATSAMPLASSLIAAGIAQPHRHGGVAVDRTTSRLTVAGRPDPRVYALGDPACGSLFFTFGMQSLVDRAVDIAQDLAAHSTATRGRADPVH
jgi:uncharacterized NAD(P)/FAD-binding protein YdhS